MFCLCSLLMKFRRKKPHTDFSQRLVLKKRLVFFGVSYCKSFSFCVVSFMCIFPLCALLFLCTPTFCRFRVCYRFLNNSFTLFLRYSVADIERRSYGEMSNRRLQYNRRKDYLAEGCSAVFFFEL